MISKMSKMPLKTINPLNVPYVKVEHIKLICKRCGQPFTWIKKAGRNELGQGFRNYSPPQYCGCCKRWSSSYKLREIIMAEQKNICAKCGTSVDVIVHHIDFDERNNAKSNLILLCWKCHGKLSIFYWSKIPTEQKILYLNEWLREGKT